jgi:hypothetical protein
MPERLDRVLVMTQRGAVTVPWNSRDALLREISGLDSAKSTVAAFEGAGASRPIEFTTESISLLIMALDVMMRNAGGPDGLPEGLFAFRNALVDELHDRGEGP